MSDYDMLRTLRYKDSVLAYDIFWKDGCVYMVCPVFINNFSGHKKMLSYNIWLLKNEPPLRTVKGLKSAWLTFEDRHIKGEIVSCKDACVLVRFSDIQSDSNNISVKLSCVVNKENVSFDITLPVSSHPSVQVACATMMYNEHEALPDWLYWHKNIGVDLFILYDNGSNDIATLNIILKDYNTIFIDWPFPMLWDLPPKYDYVSEGTGALYFGSQGGQQTHSIYKYKDYAQWIATTDIDEYIMPYPGVDLKTELNNNNDMSFIVIDNVFYKTSDKGKGRIYEKFIYRESLDNICGPARHKVIANTRKLEFGDHIAVHMMATRQPRATLDRHNNIRMNHYRGATHPVWHSRYYDDILNVRDETMREIASKFND